MRHRNIIWFGFIVAVLIALTFAYTVFFAAAQSTVRIQYGETVEGEIATTDEVDRWEFDGTQGDVIAVQIDRPEGNLVPSITLSDPAGVLLLNLDWPTEGSSPIVFTATLQTSGPHILSIGGITSRANTTGPYTLTLELQEAGTQDEGILVYGRPVSSQIDDTTFREFWTFRGTQGDVIDVMMLATDGDLDTYVSLLSPQGEVIASADVSGTGTDAALYAITLPTTGNYSISARRAGNNFGESGTTQGTYNLSVTLRRPGTDNAEPAPVVLTPGMGTRGRLNADLPTALFSVEASGVLALALDMTDPTQIGTLTVMTPDRALLNTFSGITPIRASVTLPGPGTYWIEVAVSGIRESAPVDFGINVERLATAQRAARPLIYNRPQQVMAASTQPETWYFHGQAGDLVEVTITPFQPELDDSTVQIAAPDGTVLVTRPIRTQITQALALANRGVYEIRLSEGALHNGYRIAVTQTGMTGLDFRQLSEPEDRGILSMASTVEGTLAAGGTDAWFIDIDEPHIWQFELDQSGSDVPAALAIEAPDGTWLGVTTTHRLTNRTALRVNLPAVGRYRALVFDPTHEASHSYTLQGTPGEGGELPLGTQVKGVLAAADPSDRWAVQIPPNMLFNIDLSLLAGTNIPTIHIIGPDGLLVASNAGREQRDRLTGIPITYGGQFELLISQPSTSDGDTYQIEANAVAPFGQPIAVTPVVDLPVEEVFVMDAPPVKTATRVNVADHVTPRIQPDAEFLAAAAPIDFDTLLRGNIGTTQPYQAWQFTTSAGQVIDFSVVAFTDTSGPDLIVLNAEGATVAEKLKDDATSAYMMQRFVEPGTYTLVVKLDHGGRYTLFVSTLTDIDETVPQIIPAETLTYGDTRYGEIVQPDDVQRYMFWGNAGDVINARALRTQGNTNLTLSLIDANDTPLEQAAMEALPPLVEISGYRLPADALYQLVVSHTGEEAGIAGRFALSLTLAEASTVRRAGGVLDTKGAQIASLEPNDSSHRWLFGGLPGERVTIRLEPIEDGVPTPLTLEIADSGSNVFLRKTASIGQGALVFDHVLLPRRGVYQAIVSGGRTPGLYRISFERDTRHTQDDEHAIEYGETTGKVLTPENFLDVWTFAGTEGDVVTAAVRTVRGDVPVLSLQLRAQDGTVLGTALENGTGTRIERVTLPADGHYSLIVGNIDGAFVGEAAYEITLLLEDTAARSIGTIITYGQHVEGYFFLDDAADTWIFEGQQGDVVVATATSTTPDLYPVVELVSTDWRAASTQGQALILASAQGSENGPAVLEFAIPTTGAYALTLRDQALVGGPYTLDLSTRAPTTAPPGAIRYGQSKSGQLGDIHVADAWQFEGAAGEAVTISVEPETRSQLAPVITLVDAEEHILASADASPNEIARIDAYPLTQNGIYTIVVARYLGAAGYTDGRYTVSLENRVLNTPTYPTTVYGQIQRGALDDDNASDTWTLNGTEANDVIRIYAEATSGDLDPVVRIFDAEGNTLGHADDEQGLNAELYLALPAASPVYIEVARFGAEMGVTSGNYALTVDVMYQGEITNANYALAYGDRVAGSVDGTTRSHFWEFAGEQGDTLRVKVQFPRDDSPLALYLNDAAGETLATGERDRGDSIIGSVTLPYSGNYTLEIRRPGDARAIHSPYTLDLTLLSVAESNVMASGGMITPGRSVMASFTTVSATHTWLFDGRAQVPVSLTINRISGMLPQQVALYGPDGAVVFATETPPGIKHVFATGTIQLPYDGLYTLVIGGDETVVGSTYRFALREIAADVPMSRQISPVMDGFGTITDVKPYESWSFTAEEGDILSLRASTQVGDLDPTLTLWGPDRRPLAVGTLETAAGQQTVIQGVAAQQSGDYVVTVGRVGGHTGTTGGEYRIMLRDGADAISSQAAQATDIALNTRTAAYTTGKSTTYYAFQGAQGDVVGVSVRLTESGVLPELSLETESGTTIQIPVITTEHETYVPAFALPAEGRYIIALASHAMVGYELSIFRRESSAPENAVKRNLGLDRAFAEGVLDPARPTYWQFPGDAGDVMTFTIDTSGGGLRADVTLFGPRGFVANAVENPGPALALGPIRLPATGDYVLLVGPWLGELVGSTGQYTVLATTADAGVSGSDGGHIAVWDQRVTGGFIAEDMQDVWTFDGQAGDIITIQAEQTLGEGSFSLTLTGPDGVELIGSDPATNYLGSEIAGFTLPSDGAYTITIIGRLVGESSVEYRLIVSQVPHIPFGTVAMSVESAGTLTLPMTETQYGEVSVANPVQTWMLSPSYTGTYIVTAESLVANAALDVFVAPTEVTDTATVGGTRRALVDLKAGEAYIVQVSGGPTLTQGRYALEIVPAITLTRGAALALGQPNVGRIDAAVQDNEWRLQGQANTVWIVDVTSTTGDLISDVTITGPTGGVLQQAVADNSDQVSVTFQVPADGSYAIAISGIDHTQGDYVITLHEG